MSERTCGGCTMCCKVLEILADDGSVYSPAMKWCTHCEVGKGCRIYTEPQKPSVCGGFKCTWLQFPNLPEDLRPDRCKLVVNLREERLQAMLPSGTTAPVRAVLWEVFEAREGALDSTIGTRLLTLLANSDPIDRTRAPDGVDVSLPLPVVVNRFDGARMICKPGVSKWKPMTRRTREQQAALDSERQRLGELEQGG